MSCQGSPRCRLQGLEPNGEAMGEFSEDGTRLMV